MFVQILTKIEL